MSLVTSAATRHDPIDPAFVVAGANVEFGKALLWNPTRMFDDEAVHINHPKRAVGPGADLCRAKPVVAGCQEFRMLLVRSPRRREGHAVAVKNEPVNQIVDWLANKCIPRVRRPEEFIAIDFH